MAEKEPSTFTDLEETISPPTFTDLEESINLIADEEKIQNGKDTSFKYNTPVP